MQNRNRYYSAALAVFIVSACIGIARADPPSKVQPPNCSVEEPTEYFCCGSVNPQGNNGAGSGDGCVKIAADHDCSRWLACPGGATGDHGTVACTAPKRD
jgi:hypothetical protein